MFLKILKLKNETVFIVKQKLGAVKQLPVGWVVF